MVSRLLLLVCIGANSIAAEQAIAPSQSQPWPISFTTTVRGVERNFVKHLDRVYIQVRPQEIEGGIPESQDIALTAKLRRLSGNLFGLYRTKQVQLDAIGDVLAGRLEGDNVHLVGSISAVDSAGTRILTVHAILSAPSDAAQLQSRLDGIEEPDWDRRLAVVSWCREQTREVGNADYWMLTADGLLSRIIQDMARQAARNSDISLLVRASDLSLNQLKDPGLAAQIASPVWIRNHGGPQAESLARRLRALGFALYNDVWQPRPQALELEFEYRFGAMKLKDAEGFYRLGRWADEQAEYLNQSRERSWRCYVAGNKADPLHQGIARELGLRVDPTLPGAAIHPTAITADYIDAEAKLRVAAPVGWKRGSSSGTQFSWNDPESETAFITIRTQPAPVDVDGVWSVLDLEARSKPSFSNLGQGEERLGQGKRMLFRKFSWIEGQQQRYSSVTFVVIAADAAGVIFTSQGLPHEQGRLDAGVLSSAGGVQRHDIVVSPPIDTSKP